MAQQQTRTALITGASRGIGAAIAQRLAHDGFNIVVNYSGSEAAARAVADKIKATGSQAIVAKADVSNAVEVQQMFNVAESTFGGIDVLVNNAGIMKLANIAESDD